MVDPRDQHRHWVRAHGDVLAEIGIPRALYESREHWGDFLDHGYLDHHPGVSDFTIDELTPDRLRALHRFLERVDATPPHSHLLCTLRNRAELLVSPISTAGADEIRWLAARGAHPWLVRHHELVLEAAAALVEAVARELRVSFDAARVLRGAALHDAGKLEHPEEMHAPGHAHEARGEAMLLAAGFPPVIARVCVTHAAWSEPRAALEDRLVALADKLWKGKRDADLEQALVEELARLTTRPAWDVFDAFDRICERVASEGPRRLRRSAV